MRRVDELLEAWATGIVKLTNDELTRVERVLEAIAEARARAHQVPATVDRRSLALVHTKLDEAEHWALEAMRTEGARRPEPTDLPPLPVNGGD